MSNVVLGAKSRLLVGQTAASRVDFTGVASGVDNITAGESQDTVPIPGGRGVLASQLGTARTHDFAFGAGSNARHDAVLRDANGQRLYGLWQPEGHGMGLQQFTFEMVAQVSLAGALSTDLMSWAVAAQVDGTPTAAASAEQDRELDTPGNYRLTQCGIYIGDATSRADLLGSLDSSFSLSGQTAVDRRRIGSPAGTGMTADATSCGLAASMPLRYTAEAKKLLANRTGFFFLARHDAEYAYAFPAIITAVPVQSPSTGAVLITAAIVQATVGAAVMGDLKNDESVTVGSGEQGYKVDGNGITRHTADFTVGADEYGVVGEPTVAEAAA